MESRYALRELEGAIGYDCRRLEDGRRAIFRHTSIHKSFKRDFLERKDVISVLQASFIAIASLASHPRMKLEDSYDIAVRDRRLLVESVFPYMDADVSADSAGSAQIGDYDKYFDELDEIIKSQVESGGGCSSGQDTLAAGGGNDIL